MEALSSHFTASWVNWGRLSWAFGVVFGRHTLEHCTSSQLWMRRLQDLSLPAPSWDSRSAAAARTSISSGGDAAVQTQLFWSQFKSLSHSDILCRAGFCLEADPEPTEMDGIPLTVLQRTPSKSWNSPHLTSLPWNRDNSLFLTWYPSCSTQ